MTPIFSKYLILKVSMRPTRTMFVYKIQVNPTHTILKLNKRAKMALNRSPDFLRLRFFFFFFVFREEFTRISLCLYSARSLHSLTPCLLTDQNFKNNSEKGHSRNISMRLFQNLTNSFREDFLPICLCSYSQVTPIHQSHVHGQIKISLTIFERGHSRNISVNWELEATYSVVLID